ncbi:MAG: peptidoglycan glycosyltransferase, partial [Bacillota bacterium]
YRAEMVREEEGWRVRWSPALIFPGLEEGGKVRAESLPARRGGIYDRQGRPLAVDEPARAIGLVPGKMEPDSAQRLAEALGLQVADVEAKLEQPWVREDLFVPIATLPQSRAERLEQDLLAIPGVLISSTKETARYYPQGALAAPLIGYVGPITEEELTAERRQAGYGPRDVIGKQGAESAFEEALRGRRGGRIWLERPDGTEGGEVARREPEDGHDVRLTLDIDVQRALEKAMEGARGSAVVLDPGTGEVLALASHPAFDPNRLADGITSAEWRELNEDPGAPLFNKALSPITPGSTFKPITAAVALDAGVIRPDTDFGESPERWQKDASWGNYFVKRVPHPPGRVDLIRALVWSDNVYFARVGLALGPERFTAGVERFGLGGKFPFDLPARSGQVAGEGGIRGEIQLADSAYGQGQVLVSPLQLAAMYTAFLNEGDVLRPYLLLEERDASGRVLRQGERAVLADDATRPETARVIREALRRVVADRTGTAHALADVRGWTVSGKTGTAQVQGGEGGARWRWFVAWAAPAGEEEPRYLIAMAVYQQGAGDENAPNPAVARVKQWLSSLPR